MLISIVVTNAIVLHQSEAGANAHTALVLGGCTRVRLILIGERVGACLAGREPAKASLLCLLHRERLDKRSCLYFSRALVRGDDDAARRRFRFAQGKGCRSGAFGKQALAPAQRDREYLQPQLVHQVVLQKRLDEITATVHLQFRSILRFQLFDLIDNIALQKH
jgi:hypothetical protein